MLRQYILVFCANIVLTGYRNERKIKMQSAFNSSNNLQRVLKKKRVAKKDLFFALKSKVSLYFSILSKSLEGNLIKFSLPEDLQKHFKNIIYTFMGLIFGLVRLSGNMHPFGLSFFVATSGKNALFAFLGAALSCVFNINSMMKKGHNYPILFTLFCY